jgi:hypothetical protein
MWRDAIVQVLDSVPAGCVTHFGAESDVEKEHVRDFLEEVRKFSQWEEADGEYLEALRKEVEGGGSKRRTHRACDVALYQHHRVRFGGSSVEGEELSRISRQG